MPATNGAFAESSAKSGRDARARSTKSRTASAAATRSSDAFVLGGNRERRNAPHGFARDAERLARGREHAHLGPGAEQRVRELRTGRQQVLAVVDHDEQVGLCEAVTQHLERRGARRLGQTARRDDRAGDVRAVGDARELDPDDAVRVQLGAVLRHGVGEPGLPRAARAGDRDEPALREQLADVAALALAPDQRSRPRPERRGSREPQRAEMGRLDRKLGVVELVHALRFVEAGEHGVAELVERRSFGQRIRDERRGRARDQDLASLREAAQARGPDDGEPAVVAALRELGLARVHRHADRHGRAFGPRLGEERALRGESGRERRRGAREDGEGRVSLTLVGRPEAAVRGDRLGDQLALPRERLPGERRPLPEAGRRHDVRDQERHQPGREPRRVHGTLRYSERPRIHPPKG